MHYARLMPAPEAPNSFILLNIFSCQSIDVEKGTSLPSLTPNIARFLSC